VATVIRVFLVDDHEVVRRGIADLLESEDMTIAGEAGSVAEALARVPAVRPDVAVLDVRLPDGNGVQLCRDLRSEMPDLKCLMLTSFDDDDALIGAIMAGAAGFVLKQVRGSDLVQAVKTVAAGGSLLDARSTAAVMRRIQAEQEEAARQSDPTQSLTDQERAVLELIAEGMTNRQIGERLYLPHNTHKNYVSHLLAKLGVSHRTQAAILATKLAADRR
jgi:DNA-binding NarL/FixJ family response regulator